MLLFISEMRTQKDFKVQTVKKLKTKLGLKKKKKNDPKSLYRFSLHISMIKSISLAEIVLDFLRCRDIYLMYSV